MEAFAGIKSESLKIEDLDAAAAIVNYALALQGVCDGADAGSLNAEKVSEKLLSEFHLPVSRSLTHYGEPTAHSRLDRMEVVANGRLCQLADLDITVAEKCIVKDAAMCEELKYSSGVYHIAFGRGLDECLIRHCILAENERHADHTLESGKADLDGAAILGFGEQ